MPNVTTPNRRKRITPGKPGAGKAVPKPLWRAPRKRRPTPMRK